MVHARLFVRAAIVLAMSEPAAARVAVALAQAGTGEIFGRVTDTSGAPAAGAVVTVAGGPLVLPRRFQTTRSGAFAFPELLPGTYDVFFTAQGHASSDRRGVRVHAGFHTRLDVSLATGGHGSERGDSASPGLDFIDTKSPSLSVGLAHEWMELLPLAPEEPLAHRVPALVVSPLSPSRGISLAAAGRRDALDGLVVQRSPADVSMRGPEFIAAVVRATGGSRFAGSLRYHFADHRLQANNLDAALVAQGARAGRPLWRVTEIAAEEGGPVSRNKAWAWASLSRTSAEIGGLTVTSSADARLHYQLRPAHRLDLRWSRPTRFRPHRAESPYDQPESTHRQHSLGLARPLQVEHQWLPSERIVVSSRYAFRDASYVLDFQDPGLTGVQPAYDRYTLVRWRSGSQSTRGSQAHEVAVAGTAFWPASHGDHSITFGVEFEADRSSHRDRTGGGAEAVFDSREGRPLPWQARLFRDGHERHGASRWSSYAQDSVRLGRLALQAGLRFDRLDDRAFAAAVPPNVIVPDLLPAVAFGGADSGAVFNDFSPRAGVAWDLFGKAGSVIKLAVARYHADGNDTSEVLQPTKETRLVYWWNDDDGDTFVQRSELDLARGPAATPSSNYDPQHPSSVRASTAVAAPLRNVVMDSVALNFEQQLGRRVSLGVGYTARRTSRLRSSFRVEADGTPVDSATFSPVRWTPANCPPGASCPAVTYFQRAAPLPSRTVLRNDGGYSWRHTLDAVLHRRLAGGWMLDLAFSWNRSARYFPRATRDYTDPTNIAAWNGTEHSAPAPHWAVALAGSARLPWNFRASGSWNARQGLPYDRVVSSPNRGALGSTNVLVSRYGAERYPAVFLLDGRLEWRLLVGRVSLTPTLLVFNAFNSSVVLARNRVQNSRTANNVSEITAPRSARVEVGLSW